MVWQGAAKCIGFHTALGRDIPIACAVDLNVARHGKFLPPFDWPLERRQSLHNSVPAMWCCSTLCTPMRFGPISTGLD